MKRLTHTPAEAASVLGISVETVHDMRRRGDLPAIRIGAGTRRPRFAAALQRLLDTGPQGLHRNRQRTGNPGSRSRDTSNAHAGTDAAAQTRVRSDMEVLMDEIIKLRTGESTMIGGSSVHLLSHGRDGCRLGIFRGAAIYEQHPALDRQLKSSADGLTS